jgi:hypothetical protein
MMIGELQNHACGVSAKEKLYVLEVQSQPVDTDLCFDFYHVKV